MATEYATPPAMNIKVSDKNSLSFDFTIINPNMRDDFIKQKL